MLEILGQASDAGFDFGSVGAGGAFGAGVMLALHWMQKLRQNGKQGEGLMGDLRFLMDRAENRDERIVEGLNRLTESQARMATLLDVLVQKTCQGGLVKGVSRS